MTDGYTKELLGRLEKAINGLVKFAENAQGRMDSAATRIDVLERRTAALESHPGVSIPPLQFYPSQPDPYYPPRHREPTCGDPIDVAPTSRTVEDIPLVPSPVMVFESGTGDTTT